MKKTSFIFSLLSAFLAIFFIFIISSLIIFETSFGKNILKGLLIKTAKKQNIELQIGSLSGAMLFQFKMKDVVINQSSTSINIEEAIIRIKFLPLLNHKLSFNELFLNSVTYNIKKGNEKVSDKDTWIDVPIDMTFEKIKITNLRLLDDFIINISGYGDLKKDNDSFYANLKISRKNFASSNIELEISGDKKHKIISSKTIFDIRSLQVFEPLIKKPNIDLNFNLTLKCVGPINSYLSVINNNNLSDGLSGKVYGKIYNIKDSFNPFINQFLDKETDISFDFSKEKSMKIELQKISLNNSLYSIEGNGALTKNLDLDKLNLNIEIDEINNIKEIKVQTFGSLISI